MKHGWVWVGKNRALRPFERWEEVLKGDKKGMFKIWLSGKAVVVGKEDVKIWPLPT